MSASIGDNMPETVVDNGTLRAVTSSRGGELLSLRSIKSGLEYIWQGDAAFWEERAPVLFPVVGRLYGGSYRLDGREYRLPIHGFARAKEYKVKLENNTVTYTLEADAETLAAYPYRFGLEICHCLKGQTLSTSFTVTNQDKITMYFSIGGHPGIKCPFNPGQAFDDYYLEFEKPERAERLNSSDDGLYFAPGSKPFFNGETVLPLDYSLFDNDAITLTGLASSKVSLKSRNCSNYVTFGFAGFPILALWTRRNAGYLCLEPWFGHGDILGFQGEIKDKPGILSLTPGSSFACGYSITVTEQSGC